MPYPVSGRVLNVGHDSVGRVNSDQYRTYINNFAYNGAGQVTGLSLGNVANESYGYDANRMQLTSQTATQSGGSTGGLMNLTYGYQASAGQMGAGTTAGNAGQLMSISGTIVGVIESAAYTYDDLGRLVTSNQTSNTSNAQRRFAYDRWGNRTGMWDATSGGNQIQSITLQQSGGAPTNRITSVTSGSTVNYTYDAAGNVTNDGVHSYVYDSENRIVSVDSGSTASYACDNQNRRYKKTIGATVTHYVWEGSQVLSEHNGSTGAVLTDYLYSGRRIIAKIVSGSTQYFLSDRLSLRLSLDASGNVTGRQSHLPFGEDFGESGTQEKHHFTSYERDSEAVADYAVNREYSSTVGRFMRSDPYRASGRHNAPQSWNRYSYSSNEPVDQIDRLGLDFGDPPEDPDPPHPSDPNDPFAHEHGLCPAWIRDCKSYVGSSGLNISAIIDAGGTRNEGGGRRRIVIPLPKFSAGRLTVDESCGNSVLYVPEDNQYGRKEPEKAWKDAARADRVEADFVATARGVVKIPDGCTCKVSCTGGDDYKISCFCPDFVVPSIVSTEELRRGEIVADPRSVWPWVDSRDPYHVDRNLLTDEYTFN